MDGIETEREREPSRAVAEIQQLVQINAGRTFSSISSTSSGMDPSSISDGVSQDSPRPDAKSLNGVDVQVEDPSFPMPPQELAPLPPPSSSVPPSPLPRSIAEARKNSSLEDAVPLPFFYGEPEWQRAPGRWPKWELAKLQEMKMLLEDDLRTSPPFPEVVGSRRMLRFLRGHKHDVKKATDMMRKMLQWRKDNGVDAIRSDIIENEKFFPSQFPDGEMIMKLYPLLVASPLSIDLDGGPISYESYAFSPRKVAAHAGGNLDFFIKFHIYCQELKQICLDSLSDAKEMENLARIAAQRSTRPSSAQDTKKASPGEETPGVRSPSPVPPVPRAVGIASDNNDSIGNGTRQDGSEDTATAVEGRLQGNALTAPGMSPSNGLKVSDSNSGSGGGEAPSSSADSGGAAGGRLQEDPAEPANGSSISAEGVGGSGDEDVSALDEAQKGKEEGSEDGNEEEPWGVILRNTIIRDLAGFGMEHAGPIGRSLISKVLSVSQDNYPEMMARCYIINAPWVFYALWKGLTPLVSANTARKIKVLNYDFLPTLLQTMTIDRLPKSAGGRCEPMRLAKEKMHDFVICGWVADEPVADAEASTEPDDAENSDASVAVDAKRRRPATVENRKLLRRNFDVEISDEEDDDSEVVLERRQGMGSEAFDAKASVEGREISRGSRRHAMKQRRHSDFPPDLASGGAAAVGGRKGEGTPRRSGTFRNLFGKNSKDGSIHETPPAVPTLSRSSSIKERRLTVDVSEHAAGVGSGSGSTSSAAPERSREPSRPSPGRNRPYASPGPRGVGSARAGGGGGRGGSSRGRIDSQGEDFDGRLVDRALEMSINRKAQRFIRSNDSLAEFSSGTPSELSLDDQEKAKAGWVRRKWRSLKGRRGSKKSPLGSSQRGLAISAGDCADWVPNSVRDTCLHCEKPFTLLLRRHHCRMCGELVCARCSPHRVRLNPGSGGEQEDSGSSQRPSDRKRGTVAVRVCTDCYISLQTVTVASAPSLEENQGEVIGGEGDVAGGLDDPNSQGVGRGVEAVPRAASARARVDPDVGGVGKDGWGFVGDLEAAYCATDEDIVGDIVLEDVLKWDLVKQRAERSWEIVRMCLVVVVEMHHGILLESAVAICRVVVHTLPAAAREMSMRVSRTDPVEATSAGETEHQGQQQQQQQQGGERGDAIPASSLPMSGSGDILGRKLLDGFRSGLGKGAEAEAVMWVALNAAFERAGVWPMVLFASVGAWVLGVWYGR